MAKNKPSAESVSAQVLSVIEEVERRMAEARRLLDVLADMEAKYTQIVSVVGGKTSAVDGSSRVKPQQQSGPVLVESGGEDEEIVVDDSSADVEIRPPF